jgi:hypothetical protein
VAPVIVGSFGSVAWKATVVMVDPLEPPKQKEALGILEWNLNPIQAHDQQKKRRRRRDVIITITKHHQFVFFLKEEREGPHTDR